MDSLLSGKHSRTGSKKNSQPIVQPLNMFPFFGKLKSFIHILCWQSCSFSSALWWIRQPYSARAVRLEQRASVIITLMIKDHINSRSQIIADLEVNFPLQWHLWCARVYCVSWAERQWTINYQLLPVTMKARRRNKQRWILRLASSTWATSSLNSYCLVHHQCMNTFACLYVVFFFCCRLPLRLNGLSK